jgi:hypothetical protein
MTPKLIDWLMKYLRRVCWRESTGMSCNSNTIKVIRVEAVIHAGMQLLATTEDNLLFSDCDARSGADPEGGGQGDHFTESKYWGPISGACLFRGAYICICSRAHPLLNAKNHPLNWKNWNTHGVIPTYRVPPPPPGVGSTVAWDFPGLLVYFCLILVFTYRSVWFLQ